MKSSSKVSTHPHSKRLGAVGIGSCVFLICAVFALSGKAAPLATTAPFSVDTRDYTLAVLSPCGDPAPSPGIHTYNWGQTLRCFANPTPGDPDCQGWSVDGALQDWGAGTETDTLRFDGESATTHSTLRWKWTDNESWASSLHVTAGDRHLSSLAFGLASSASDGWDESLDAPSARPSSNQPGAVWVIEEAIGAIDFRNPQEVNRWLLRVSAPTDDPATISAASGNLLPEGRHLTIYQALPAAWEEEQRIVPLGGTAESVRESIAWTVPAGQTQLLCLHLADYFVYDLYLQDGWNLCSLPLTPEKDESLDALSRASQIELAPSTPPQRTLLRPPFWGWGEGRYQAVEDVDANTPYWVEAREPLVLLHEGLHAVPAEKRLVPGWNLVAVAQSRSAQLPSAGRGAFWCWDASRRRYEAVTSTLLPGVGYWIFCDEPGSWTP